MVLGQDENGLNNELKLCTHISNEAELFAHCSLLVTFCSLLVPLLVTFCLLLVARYFLLLVFCSLLVTLCSLLFALCSLFFARCSLFFHPNYCKIKLLWTAKKWFDYNKIPPQILSLQISEFFVTFSGWWFSNFSQHAKPFSKLT